ncbi:MAG: FGGY-family carbohydrate kinase [Bacillota bacterium]
MQAIVGIDIGTTNIKVNAFDTGGNPLYSTSRHNRVIEQGNQYDLDGSYIMEQVLEMLAELVDNEIRILSIGVSSLAESVFPVAGNGELEEKTMIWYDKRSRPQQERFHEDFTRSDFYNITGLNSEFLFSIFKLLWYYNHRPRLFEEADSWLPVNSYLVYKLTGKKAMDYSIASRTGALDIQNRDWSPEIFDNLPFSADVFPPLEDSAQNPGKLKQEYRERLGIDYEIPVSLGGHDHICGSFAVAAFQGRVILDSMGTSENILGISRLDQLDLKELYQRRLNFGLHVVPGRVYLYHAFNYSSVIINNLISLFFNKSIGELGDADFRKFNREARKYQDRELPIRLYVEQNEDRFLDTDQLKDLNLLNIPLNVDRGQVFMAVIRYLCHKSRQIIDNLEQVIPVADEDQDPAEVIAIGGSTKNKLWMEEKARLLAQSLYINGIEKAVTLGGALLGGVGAGYYQDYREAVASINRDREVVT